MHKALGRLLGSAALACCATLGHAQFVMTVDDNPGDDTGYMDGGNVSGAGALQTTLNTMMSDGAITGAYEVRILDTDGVADTYTGGFTFAKNNGKVYQIDNPLIDDAPATIIGNGTWIPNGLPAIFTQADNCELSGISTAKRLKISAGTHVFATGLNAASGLNMLWQNLEYVDGVGATTDHEDYNTTNAVGSPIFRGCRFTYDNGPSVRVNGTLLENCIFDAPGWKMFADASGRTISITGSAFNGGAASAFYISGGTTLNVSTSSFNSVMRVVSQNAFNGFFDGSTLNLDQCTFTGTNGDVAFWMGTANGTINISNSNLVDIATVLTARMNAGTMTFTNCLVQGRAIDTAGSIAASGVTITFDRSTVIGATVGAGADAGSTGPLHIRAVNSVFNPGGAASVLEMGNASTIADDLQTTHCTFFGPSANILIGANNADTIQGWYNVYDSSQAASTSVNGTQALTGVGNLIHPTGFVAVPGDTILGQPANLDANGRPNVGSYAINNAAASTMLVDRDNVARPLGLARDIGAFETALTPVELSGFSIE